MSTINVRGHEFPAFAVKDSFNRRAVQFKNAILGALRKVGVSENQTEIDLEPFALKNSPASVTWWMDGQHLYYSYDSCGKFVENLYVVSKVILLEVEALLNGQKPLADFIAEFSEDEDVEEKRKEARDVLGLTHDTKDIEVINKRFKLLAKEHHPDASGGNLEKFKEINRAHKILKRELG